MASTDLVKPDQFRALAATADQFATAVEALREQEVDQFDLTRIKIPTGGGQTFEIPDARGGQSVRTLQGIIVFTKNARAWWPGAYEGGNEPPACSSDDGRTARQTTSADPETGEPITIPAERDDAGRLVCDTCRFAEYGTKLGQDGKQTRGQACKQMLQVFMILPNRLLPAVLTLPPTSLKNGRRYLLDLVDEMVPTFGVLTEVELEVQQNPGTPKFSVAKFKLGADLSPEQTERAKAYAAAAKPSFMRVRVQADDLPGEERAAAGATDSGGSGAAKGGDAAGRA